MLRIERRMKATRMFYVAGMLLDFEGDEFEPSIIVFDDVRVAVSRVLSVIEKPVGIKRVYDYYSWLGNPLVVIDYNGVYIGLYVVWRGFERKLLFMAATPLGDVDKVVRVVDEVTGGRVMYRGVMARIPRPVSHTTWKGLFEVPVIDDKGFYEKVKSAVFSEVVRGDRKPKVYHIALYNAWAIESKKNMLRAYIQATARYVRVAVLSKKNPFKAMSTLSRVLTRVLSRKVDN